MQPIQEPVRAGHSFPVRHHEYPSCVGAKVAKAVSLRTQCAQWSVRHVRAIYELRLYIQRGWDQILLLVVMYSEYVE